MQTLAAALDFTAKTAHPGTTHAMSGLATAMPPHRRLPWRHPGQPNLYGHQSRGTRHPIRAERRIADVGRWSWAQTCRRSGWKGSLERIVGGVFGESVLVDQGLTA